MLRNYQSVFRKSKPLGDQFWEVLGLVLEVLGDFWAHFWVLQAVGGPKAKKPMVFQCFRAFSSWFSWGLALGGLGSPFGTSCVHFGNTVGDIGAQSGTNLEPF